MARYVAVSATDENDKVIKLGPLEWDGETPYNPGDEYRLLLEADALEQGYTYPPPENPPSDDPAPEGE